MTWAQVMGTTLTRWWDVAADLHRLFGVDAGSTPSDPPVGDRPAGWLAARLRRLALTAGTTLHDEHMRGGGVT